MRRMSNGGGRRFREADSMWALAPRSSTVWLFVGVFFLFAPLPAVMVSRFFDRGHWAEFLVWVVSGGLIAAGWAAVGTVNRRLLGWMIGLHVVTTLLFLLLNGWILNRTPPRPTVEGVVMVGLVVAGYVFFCKFIAREGTRAVRLTTEMNLAGQIHRRLVAPIERKVGAHEIYGRSEAGAEMGGDLIDLVEREHGADLFLIDVSGHGVRAGVLMAMIKSAVRMRLRSGGALDEVVEAVDAVIHEVKEPDMFATGAAVRLDRNARAVRFVLGGHLPILYWSAMSGEVRVWENEALPLGVAEGTRYPVRKVECEAGDVLVLYTDGWTEIFDGRGGQLGVDGFRKIVARHVCGDLEKMFRGITEEAGAHGPQSDDQSLVLVKVG